MKISYLTLFIKNYIDEGIAETDDKSVTFLLILKRFSLCMCREEFSTIGSLNFAYHLTQNSFLLLNSQWRRNKIALFPS